MVRRQHALLVELEARRAATRAATNPVAIKTLRAAQLGAVGDAHGATVGRERARAGDDRDLAALQQRLEAARQPVDHLLLADLGDRHVERGRRRLHAELGRVADGAVDLGGLQQLLGRDAAAVQAGAADPALLDHGDVQAGRCAVERGGVSAGPATQHDEVELGHRGITPLSSATTP